jgi:threonylcarbamoyladenosine tRNA methylthiotransferase MtaB
MSEIARASAAGFREIALTGVHLGSFGRDLPEPCSLWELLTTIETDGPSDVRFRISSLEPMDCSNAIVDLVAGSRRFAPHFHLPLQHASDRLLAAMRRPYTLTQYRRLVDRIRERMPHASIGSDAIVGFPGETDGDFAELEAYLAASPLTHVHVFPYSDRPGTDASVMGGKVHGSVVRARAMRLRDVSRNLTTAFQRAQNGTVRPGLTIEDGSIVVTDNYLKAKLATGIARNEAVVVRLTTDTDQLTAELVSPQELYSNAPACCAGDFSRPSTMS